MFIELLNYHNDVKKELRDVANNYPKHLHDFYELYLFLNGNINYIIEDKNYEMKPYRLLLIKPYQYHFPFFKKTEEYGRICMHFRVLNDKDMVDNLFNKIKIIDLDKSPQLISIFQRLLNCKNLFNKKETFYYAESCLTEFILTANKIGFEKQENDVNCNSIIKNVIQYINDNISNKITLKELSQKFYINQNYLSKLFKKDLYVPIVTYIKNKQLLLADNMIKNGIPPTDVYIKCGFNDYSSFYRSYKKMFNCPPSFNKK